MSMLRKAFWSAPAVLCTLGALASTGAQAFADWPLTSWWTRNCETEVGDRQHCHNGKRWPLEPRPTGPAQPFMQRVHTSIYWPDPYRWEDRGMVRAALATQRDNGWITATTLYDQHFDAVTNEINEAGKVHLRWILLHIPPNRRLAWVAAGNDPQTSKVRLESVQEESNLIAGRNACPVMLRVCLPVATSAQDVDLIRRAYLESIPNPRVPYVPLSSQGGGSGSSGGGSPQTPQGGTGK